MIPRSFLFTSIVAATLATSSAAKDMADIRVGVRLCWAGLVYNSAGVVTHKNWSDKTVTLRLDNGKYAVAPASEIASLGFCKVTGEIHDQVIESLFNWAFSGSSKSSEDR